MAENLPPSDVTPNRDAEPKKKRKGWWWKLPLLLLILLGLLVAFLPAIASTGAVRSFVLGKVNSQVDGRLEISDWSLSWTGGVSVSGMKLYDGQGRLVLEMSRFSTPASLIGVARGNLDFGKTTLEDLNLTQLEVYPDGSTNYHRIFSKMIAGTPGAAEQKMPAAEKKAAAQPKIDLSIKPLRGTIMAVDEAGNAVASPLEIRPESEIAARLGAATEPISERVNLVLAVAGKPAGSLLVEGTALIPEKAQGLKANQKVSIKSLDLGALSPLLAFGGVKGEMLGIFSGDLAADIASMDQGEVKGEFEGVNLEAGGQMLHGDKVRTKKLKMPIHFSLSPGQVVTGSVSVVFDQGNLLVQLESLPVPALQRLMAGGAPGAVGSARVSADIQKIPELLNMLKNSVKLQEGVAVTGGTLTANVGAQLMADGLRVDAPINLVGLSATQAGRKIGPMQPINLSAGAKLAAGSNKPELRDLSVDFASSFARFKASGATLAQVQGEGDADVAQLREQLGEIFDLSMFRSGRVHFAIANAGAAGGRIEPSVNVTAKDVALDLPASDTGTRMIVENAGFSLSARPVIEGALVTLPMDRPLEVNLDATLITSDGKTRRTVWSDSPVKITASGSLTQMKKLVAKAVIALPFAEVKVQELAMVLPAPADAPADFLAMVETATLTVEVADLARAWAAMERFTPPAADHAAPALQLAGKVDVLAELRRVAQSSEFTLNTTATGVNVRRGETSVAMDKAATVKLAGAVNTRPGKEFSQQIAGARVASLNAEVGPARMELTKPIILPELAALMQAMSGKTQQLGELGGAIHLSGDLAEIAKLADAFAGTKPGAPSVLPLQGQLSSQQEIAYQGGVIWLRGNTPIQNLKVMQAGKVAFSESQATLKNDVSLDLGKRILKMEDVSLKLIETDALAFSVKGQINDYGRTQAFQDLVVTLTPDLAKVWTIIQPLLPPEKQATVGRLVLGGKPTVRVPITGAYPMTTADGKAVAPAESLKSVRAQGEFVAELVDWQEYGMKIERLPVPFVLKNGQLETVYPDGKTAAPASFNEGKLYLPHARIDLLGEHMLLYTPQNVKLLEAIRLNSVMASLLGDKVTPFLYESKDAAGLVDVTIVRCEALPLDASMMSNDRSNKGVAELLVSATQLDIASKGAGMVLGFVGFTPAKGQERIVGNMKDARIKIEGGRVDHNMNIMFGQYGLGLRGDLNLADRTYRYFNMDVPSEMLEKRVGSKDLLQYLPARVGLSFAGPVTALRLNEKFLNDLVKGAVQKQVQSRLLGGGKESSAAEGAAGTTGGIGGLLDAISGEKKDPAISATQTTKTPAEAPVKAPAKTPAKTPAKAPAKSPVKQPARKPAAETNR